MKGWKSLRIKLIIMVLAVLVLLTLSAMASLTSQPPDMDENDQPVCEDCRKNASSGDIPVNESHMVANVTDTSGTQSSLEGPNGLFAISLDQPPAAATLISSSGILSNSKPTYVWNKTENTLFYCLNVNNSLGNPVIKQWYAAEDFVVDPCSVTPLSTLQAGDYSWSIQTWNCTGRSWSIPLDFTICSSSSYPGKAALVFPKGIIGTSKPTYVWNAVAGSREYHLKVININNPNHPVIDQWYDSVEVLSDKTCSIKPDVPLAPGIYRLWIQARNCKGDGQWSNYLTFRTVYALPGRPSPISPQGLISTLTPVFRWTAVPYATQYNLQLEDGSGTNILDEWFDATDVTSGLRCQTLLPISLPGSGDYCWRIRASNDAGNGTWSGYRCFEVVCGGDAYTSKAKLQKPDVSAKAKSNLHGAHLRKAAAHVRLARINLGA